MYVLAAAHQDIQDRYDHLRAAQIKEWVRDNHGWSIHHDCWIAHCKELAASPGDGRLAKLAPGSATFRWPHSLADKPAMH